MRRYCLTYDTKDSDAFYTPTLKIDITKALSDRGAINFSSPTGSTIVFEENGDANKISFWDEILKEYFEDKMVYYLCLVAKIEDEQIDKDHGNDSLSDDFKRYADTL